MVVIRQHLLGFLGNLVPALQPILWQIAQNPPTFFALLNLCCYASTIKRSQKKQCLQGPIYFHTEIFQPSPISNIHMSAWALLSMTLAKKKKKRNTFFLPFSIS